jgi:DNA-directed RNA polymerase specialized sigma24 family protein
MANIAFVSTSGRKSWVMADEETEATMFEYQPGLFYRYSPERLLIAEEDQMEEERKCELLSITIQDAIDMLPKDQQQLIYLCYFDDGADAYTARAIADKLGISVRKYYYSLKEAKRALRLHLENQPTVIEYYV